MGMGVFCIGYLASNLLGNDTVHEIVVVVDRS